MELNPDVHTRCPYQLKDKVIFITDAASPAGIEIACKAAQARAFLALNSWPSDKMDILENNTEIIACKPIITCEDLCKKEKVSDVVNRILGRHGRIDIMVCNHDKVFRSSIEACTTNDFEETFRENVKYAFFCTQVIGQVMAAQRSGKIIYIGSIHDEKPSGSVFAYSMAKAALLNMANEAALQLGEHGIDVNLIEMGPVAREVFQDGLTTFYDNYQYKIPSCKVGNYQDLANLVAFLASDASQYLNGAVIRMDGGLVLHFVDTKANYRKLRAEGRL
jgi:NAD(P)-dependent dehydrogenase (short-subunit alcohol dehydrogenase family)